jgi:hypothetical protein
VRARLAKLARTSGKLRTKVAAVGLLGKLLNPLRTAKRWARKNPGSAIGATAVGGLGVMGAAGSYRSNKAGFDPQVQKAMLGPTPTPPGTES